MAVLTLNDVKQRALAFNGFSAGAINDNELAWLKSLGAPAGSTLQDAWMAVVTAQGFTSGSLGDRLMQFLGGLGFTGALDERLFKWYLSNAGLGNPPPALNPNASGADSAGQICVATFTKNVNTTNNQLGFTVQVDGVPWGFQSAGQPEAGAGGWFWVMSAPLCYAGQVVTIAYDAVAGDVTGADGSGAMASFTSTQVLNNSTVPPP